MNPMPTLFRPILGFARPIDLRPLAQLIIVLALGLLVSGRAGAQGSMASCPDVAGEYQIAGFDAPLHDALEVMGLSSSAAAGYFLELQAPTGDRIDARTVFGGTSAARPRSAVTWTFERDFTCPYGSYAFSQRQVRATRKIDDVFYMGTSTVRMSKSGDNGLLVVVEFRGNTTIGLPFQNQMKKPGIDKTFTDVLNWPPASAARNRPAPAPTPKLELDVRRMWSKLMPDVVLGWVDIRGPVAILSLRAQDEKQVAAIEERLRSASISYAMKTKPTWVGNGYFMELELTQGVPR
jgi:hypothetical protein